MVHHLTCTQENCILNENELPWFPTAHPSVASNWDKKREKSIEWGVQAGGGRERSTRLTVIAPHLGLLALLPPITNCTLDPTQWTAAKRYATRALKIEEHETQDLQRDDMRNHSSNAAVSTISEVWTSPASSGTSPPLSSGLCHIGFTSSRQILHNHCHVSILYNNYNTVIIFLKFFMLSPLCCEKCWQLNISGFVSKAMFPNGMQIELDLLPDVSTNPLFPDKPPSRQFYHCKLSDPPRNQLILQFGKVHLLLLWMYCFSFNFNAYHPHPIDPVNCSIYSCGLLWSENDSMAIYLRLWWSCHNFKSFLRISFHNPDWIIWDLKLGAEERIL